MKSTMGRGELLVWLNGFVQTSYQKVEQCSDGVGYCQVIDALHPGQVPLHKVRMLARSQEDHLHNLRLLNDVLAKLKLQKRVNAQKVGKGIFLENLNLLQWLHSYANQQPAPEPRYQGFQARQSVSGEMAGHLVPSEHLLEDQKRARYQQQMNSFIFSLERDIKAKMEVNYRQITSLNGFVKQRNQHYDLLRKIEKICASQKSALAKQILQVIAQTPPHFHPAP